jgi:hypothetical protein
MKQAAQLSADHRRDHREPETAAGEGQTIGPMDKVVSLFSGSGDQASDPPGRAREGTTEQDWSATIDRVRRAASQRSAGPANGRAGERLRAQRKGLP